jgi:hypothetical protein
MKKSFTAVFKTENDFSAFSRWLSCFESDFRIQANATIRFLRISGSYAKVILAPSGRYDKIFHAVRAFNGQAFTE